MILTKEQLFSADDRPVKTFVSKIWGGEIKYREITVRQKENARLAARSQDSIGQMTKFDNALFDANIIVSAVVEPQLSLMDVDALLGRNANEVDRLSKACIGVSQENPR